MGLMARIWVFTGTKDIASEISTLVLLAVMISPLLFVWCCEPFPLTIISFGGK